MEYKVKHKGVFLCCLVVCWVTGMMVMCCSSVKSDEERYLQTALQLSGDNRPELDSVLYHYKDNPEKLSAAKFLIANMLYGYSCTDPCIDSLKQVLKEAIRDDGVLEPDMKHRWKKIHVRPDIRVADINTITSDILIENIDLAFSVWKRRPWSKYYSRDVFFNYVLPYRLDNEPLESWRPLYYNRYAVLLDSLYQGTDVVEAAECLHDILRKEGFFHNRDFSIPHLGARYLWENRIGYCRDKTDLICYAFRAAGIPVASDSYYVSNTYVGNHNWVALIDTTGRCVPFEFEDTKGIHRQSASGRKRGKVYRRMSSIQPERWKGMYSDPELYARFRQPYVKDVSSEYSSVETIRLEVDGNPPVDERYVYLSVFDGHAYEPIDVTLFHPTSVAFQHVEPDLIYQLTSCREGVFFPMGYPFELNRKGIRYFRPDDSALCTVRLNRKFPDTRVKNYMETAVGVRIEGSLDKQFRSSDLLCEVVDTPRVNLNVVLMPSPRKYRYIRYRARQGRFLQLAELGIYADTLLQDKLHPSRIEADTLLPDEEMRQIQLVDDGDWVSFYKSKRKGESLIFDLGQPQWVSALTYIPRNDDNYVRQGDWYELFYQDGDKGWQSLGRQRASSSWLVYHQVPSNALLLLRNHTRGKEERAFYYKNDKQIFP